MDYTDSEDEFEDLSLMDRTALPRMEVESIHSDDINEDELFGENIQEPMHIERECPLLESNEFLRIQKSQNYVSDLPLMLRVEPKIFDVDKYEEVLDDDEMVCMENTIRWRLNNGVMESNAEMIQWDDGSSSLMIGMEMFDVRMFPVSTKNYLFSITKPDDIFVSECELTHKIMFQPYDASDKTNQRMVELLASKFQKKQKTKIVNLDRDPEVLKQEVIRAEKESLKAQIRMESKKKSVSSKYNVESDDYESVIEFDSEDEKAQRLLSHHNPTLYEDNEEMNVKRKKRLI